MCSITCRQRQRVNWRDVAALRSTFLATSRGLPWLVKNVCRDVAHVPMSDEILLSRMTSPDVATNINRAMSPDWLTSLDMSRDNCVVFMDTYGLKI